MIVSILQMRILRHRKKQCSLLPSKKMQSWVCVVSEPELNHEGHTEKTTSPWPQVEGSLRALDPGRKARAA